MASLSTSTSVVKIGHARGTDEGQRAYADLVAITDWYGGWTSVYRHSSVTVQRDLVECMKRLCGNDNIGYQMTSADRDHAWKILSDVNFDPSKVTLKILIDCSLAISVCCKFAGFNVAPFTTASEDGVLVNLGFQKLTGTQYSKSQAGLCVGDVLLKSGHTAMVVSITGESTSGYLVSSASSSAALTTDSSSILVGTTTLSEKLQKNTLSIDPNNVLGLNDIFNITTETVSREVERDLIHTVTSDYDLVKSSNLLSVPTYVESPFVILLVGQYKFGTYAKQEYDSSLKVTFPNFIQGLTVTKINGTLNQYVINLVYAIQAGDDPNLVDRIFSTVGYGTVKVSYGDWCMPSFIYKEEEATLTKVTTTVNWQSSQIAYTVYCTSNAISLASTTYSFDSGTFKPSDKIKQILQGPYGLQQAFSGMFNSQGKLKLASYIASDDKAVEVPAKSMDAVSYINFLTTYMVSYDDSLSDGLKKSNYYLTLYDDVLNTAGGPYFKINKITSSSQTLASEGVYEIDVGYTNPSEYDSNVINFNITNDNNWALLYNYNDTIQDQSYVFDVSDNGKVTSKYSPNVLTSSKIFKTTEAQKSWWTLMTQFPIKATLTLKGLVKPVLLMTNVKINALFFGQRHVSSGIYTITKQVDTVNQSGFKTELSLMRIAGDDDYIKKTKVTETSTRTRFSAAHTIDVAADVADTYTFSDILNDIFSVDTDAVQTAMERSARSVDMGTDTDTIANASSYISSTNTNIPAAWNYLLNKIGNKYAVAGIMGNMMVESAGFHPDIKLNDLPYKPEVSQAYVKKVDSGQIPKSEFIKGTFGFGLCQWTWPSRKDGLYEYCKVGRGGSIGSLTSQLEYFWKELTTGYTLAYNALLGSKSIKDATWAMYEYYEGPPDTDTSFNTRLQYATQFYNTYA